MCGETDRPEGRARSMRMPLLDRTRRMDSAPTDPRRRSTGRLGAMGTLVVPGLLLALASGTGCESTAARALEGARHYVAGSQALETGDGQRAIEELERAALLVPHASEIQNHLGLAYWSEGRVERAYVAFERAIELDCDNEAAHQNLASLRDGDAKRAPAEPVPSSARAVWQTEGNEHGG